MASKMDYDEMEELMEDPEQFKKMEAYKEAIRTRNLKDTKKYFKKFGFNVYDDGIVGSTLHYAVLYDEGDCKIIRFFIDQGEDIERYLLHDSYAEDKYEQFEPHYGMGDMGPLAYAVINKRIDVVATLLQLGADPFGKKDTLDTPIIHASFLKDESDAILYTYTLLHSAYKRKYVRRKVPKNQPLYIAQEYIDILEGNLYNHPDFNGRMVGDSVEYHEDYFFDKSPKNVERRIKFLKCAEEIYAKHFA